MQLCSQFIHSPLKTPWQQGGGPQGTTWSLLCAWLLGCLGCPNHHHASSSRHGHISWQRHRLTPEVGESPHSTSATSNHTPACVVLLGARRQRPRSRGAGSALHGSHRSTAAHPRTGATGAWPAWTSQQRHQHTIVIDIIAHHHHRLRHQSTPGPAESSDPTTPLRPAYTSCLAPQRGVVWVHRVRASHTRAALGHTPV